MTCHWSGCTLCQQHRPSNSTLSEPAVYDTPFGGIASYEKARQQRVKRDKQHEHGPSEHQQQHQHQHQQHSQSSDRGFNERPSPQFTSTHAKQSQQQDQQRYQKETVHPMPGGPKAWAEHERMKRKLFQEFEVDHEPCFPSSSSSSSSRRAAWSHRFSRKRRNCGQEGDVADDDDDDTPTVLPDNQSASPKPENSTWSQEQRSRWDDDDEGEDDFTARQSKYERRYTDGTWSSFSSHTEYRHRPRNPQTFSEPSSSTSHSSSSAPPPSQPKFSRSAASKDSRDESQQAQSSKIKARPLSDLFAFIAPAESPMRVYQTSPPGMNIKSLYRAATLSYHPDKPSGSTLLFQQLSQFWNQWNEYLTDHGREGYVRECERNYLKWKHG